MNRTVLKTIAKNTIFKNYPAAFLGCLAYSIIVGQFGANVSAVITFIIFTPDSTPQIERIGFTGNDPLSSVASVTAWISVVLLLLVYIIFLVGPLTVGRARFFLNARENTFTASSYFEIFRDERYNTALKAMTVKNMIVGLGFLLIIPGIYFKYTYYFVPMIIAEDKSVTWKQALETSALMTRGHKFDLFVLELSFIGWFLLRFLFIFSEYLVNPYYYATITEAYITLKNENSTETTVQ